MIPLTPEDARCVCLSCGVPYGKHLGLQGVCAKLQAIARLPRYCRCRQDEEYVRWEDVKKIVDG